MRSTSLAHDSVFLEWINGRNIGLVANVAGAIFVRPQGDVVNYVVITDIMLRMA